MADSTGFFDFNESQGIYTLSMLANLVGGKNGTEPELQKQMEMLLPKYIGERLRGWEVMWGPMVWNNGAHVPVNVWYVATNASSKLCVVAIAGTAPASWRAWITINFAINTVVDFNGWTSTWKTTLGANQDIKPVKEKHPKAGKAYISYGTALGVSNLLNKVSPPSAKAPGTRLHQYLGTIPADYQVIFTGHSMGGALSPTLALGLIQAGIAGLDTKSVEVYPSAGASPGNDIFSSKYGGRGANVYNPHDIVPMAWGIRAPPDQNIGNILGKIFTNLPLLLKVAVAALVDQAISRSTNSGVIYGPIQSTQIPTEQVKPPHNCEQLRSEMTRQHVEVYLKYWGIKPAVDGFDRIFTESLGEPQKSDDMEGEFTGEMKTVTLVDGTECEYPVCTQPQ